MDSVACASDATCVSCGDVGNPCFSALYEVRVSSCGGFNPGLTTYCDAERLQWRYSANSASLDVKHWRFLAPCLADIKASLQLEGGVYHLIETDVAEAPDDCICAFDVEFNTHMTDLHPTLEIGAQLFELDLSAEQGDAIVNDEPTPYCE